MFTKLKSKWLIFPVLLTVITLGGWLFHQRPVRADPLPDLSIDVWAPVATPDVISVNTASRIDLKANLEGLPDGTTPEDVQCCPAWTFSWVKAQYVTTTPAGGFGTFDWTAKNVDGSPVVPDATEGTDYTEDLGSSTSGGSALWSGEKSFQFTPKKAGYWHLTVSANVTVQLNSGAYYNAPADQNSPATGMALTAVNLNIIWSGVDNIKDTAGHMLPTGTSIESDTCYMVVGRGVNLQATMEPADLTISSPIWTIPHTVGPELGRAVVNYATNPPAWWNSSTPMDAPATGRIETLSHHSDLLHVAPPCGIHFYWSMIASSSETDVVEYSISTLGPISGNIFSISAHTTFTLEAPTLTDESDIVINPPSVRGNYFWNKGKPTLSLAGYYDAAGNFHPGISIGRHTTEPPDVAGPGAFQWVQVCNSWNGGYEFYGFSGSPYTLTWQPISGLDKLYPSAESVGMWRAGGSSPSGFQDSPDEACHDHSHIVHGSFQAFDSSFCDDYLLYQPAGADALPVPIWEIQWEWGATASLTPGASRWLVGSWTVTGPYASTVYNGVPSWYHFDGNIYPGSLE